MGQFINNLINDKSLDAYNYNNYLEYAIDVNSFLYMVDGCKEDEVWKAYYSIFEEWETTNIRNQIVPLQSREKIIMFVNRSTLFKQQKILMNNRVTFKHIFFSFHELSLLFSV